MTFKEIIEAHIQRHSPPPFSWAEYWKREVEMGKDRPVLKLLRRPCHDCAITTGFYQEFADALAKETPETQLTVAQKWYCHNHCNRACRGAANFLNLQW